MVTDRLAEGNAALNDLPSILATIQRAATRSRRRTEERSADIASAVATRLAERNMT